MATKVKCFKDESLFDLREKVTEFLKEHPEIKIIASNLDYEIKYSSKSNSFISHEGSHCMILIYECDENHEDEDDYEDDYEDEDDEEEDDDEDEEDE